MVRSRTEALKILGLRPESKEEDWKSAYRNIVKVYHPDNISGSGIWPEGMDHAARLKYSEQMLSLAKEAIDFLQSENVCIIGNQPKKTSPAPNKPKVVGGGEAYSFSHDQYKQRQQRLHKLDEERKQKRLDELKLKNDILRENERKHKEKEILDQIRWLRVAQIIYDTIEKDKKEKGYDSN